MLKNYIFTTLNGSFLFRSDSIGLHQVGNTNDKGAVSLHLYSPPYSKCYTFKPQTGEKSEANITFWSKFGERVVPSVKLKKIIDRFGKLENFNSMKTLISQTTTNQSCWSPAATNCDGCK
jgi:hypothetical protein